MDDDNCAKPEALATFVRAAKWLGDVFWKVGDQKIHDSQFRRQYDQRYQQLVQMMGENFRADMFDQNRLREAVLRDMTIRVLGYVGPPTSDVTVGWVGADRIVSDGTTEIPDVSIAEVPRVNGVPGKDTLLAALKDVLREAAKG